SEKLLSVNQYFPDLLALGGDASVLSHFHTGQFFDQFLRIGVRRRRVRARIEFRGISFDLNGNGFSQDFHQTQFRGVGVHTDHAQVQILSFADLQILPVHGVSHQLYGQQVAALPEPPEKESPFFTQYGFGDGGILPRRKSDVGSRQRSFIHAVGNLPRKGCCLGKGRLRAQQHNGGQKDRKSDV